MSCCNNGVATAEFTVANLYKNGGLEEQQIIQNSHNLSEGRYCTVFIVSAMHCAACIRKIEKGLIDLDVVNEARANLSMRTVSVIWKPKLGSILEVQEKLTQLGFEHHVEDANNNPANYKDVSKSLLLALAVAGFSAANIMLLSISVWSGADRETAHLFHLISGLIAVPAVAFSGRPFFHSAFNALSAGRLNMDVPISLAIGLALGMSLFEALSGGDQAYFDASVTLLFFLLIGRYLDQMIRQKARSAVERIVSLSSKAGVLILPDGSVQHINLKDILPGMKLRIFAGERFPVNGKIYSGASLIDRSHVSGESENVSISSGEVIEAGCLNLSAPVDMEAISTADTSFLAEMRKMIEVAEQGRSNYVRVADRMAQIYAPAVHLLALFTFIIWMITTQGDWHTSLYTAIAVLIITCPCALGLAVPVAHVISANRLMQNGILMRDGTGLERLAKINCVVFDKTGTLTAGSSTLQVSRELSAMENSVLKTMAESSLHPRAKVISEWVPSSQNICLQDLVEHSGLGMEANYEGQKIRLGKPEWVAKITNNNRGLSSSSSVAFGVAGNELVEFELCETLRSDAAIAVDALKSQGLHIEILSGDTEEKVAQIASRLKILNYASSKSPSQKMDRIQKLRNDGSKILMVGDGINDGPALVSGDASIVPSSGSDVGRQVADFIFTGKSLNAVAIAIRLAKLTDIVVHQNFALALAYNCIAVPLAMAGYVTPLIAAVAMSASSIAVVANSFRINFSTKLNFNISNPSSNVDNLPKEGAFV